MDYGYLISESWRLTWRYRFLWVLGLFAGGSLGSCSPSFSNSFPAQWRFPQGEAPVPPLAFQQLGQEVADWVTRNLGLILLAAAVLALLALAYIVLSLIAQGGMASATADLARGRSTSAGQAWSAGLRLAWRYLLLWLILIGIMIAVALIVAAVLGVFFIAAGGADGSARSVLIAVGVLLALVVFLAAIPFLIGLNIVVALAQRAIAVEDIGPLAALERGVRLFRANLGSGLLSWLLSLALGIGAAIAIGIALVVLLIPLGIVGVVLFSAVGVTAASIIYAILAALVLIAAAFVLGAIANTFFWSFWTLLYLSFSGQISLTPERPAV